MCHPLLTPAFRENAARCAEHLCKTGEFAPLGATLGTLSVLLGVVVVGKGLDC